MGLGAACVAGVAVMVVTGATVLVTGGVSLGELPTVIGSTTHACTAVATTCGIADTTAFANQAFSSSEGEGGKQEKTEPVDLEEKLAMEKPMTNPSKNKIMGNRINDPKYKDSHDKIEYSHDHGDGTNTTIHSWRERLTGKESGFKFKDLPENSKSRLYKK